ncbi:protein required for normal CLN1 and CLN2 G1 cyclin expression [Microbotryomycetes sp. JL221]|nr:protein required for normal CLN1 and CLN2 G1 cyclin expression [Microbotryomycetes sp. JL221]
MASTSIDHDVQQPTQPTPTAPVAHRVLDVVVQTGENLTVELDELVHAHQSGQQEFAALVASIRDMLQLEHAPVNVWSRFIEEVWRLGHKRHALDLIDIGLDSEHEYMNPNPVTSAHIHPLPPPVMLSQRDDKGKVVLLCMRANYLISLARQAPMTLLLKPRSTMLQHSKDPNHPESKDSDPTNPPTIKDEYWQQARIALEQARTIDRNNKTVRDLQAIIALVMTRIDEATKLFDDILRDEPTHLYALTGRARILAGKRSFRPALKAFQHILTLSPKFLPDPRIGIGYCLWMLGDRNRARKAWERSIAVHPDDSTSATLLLGLAHLNSSKDVTLTGGEEARTNEYAKGMTLIQKAFKSDNTLAAAAGPIANHFLLAGKPGTIKLAERMIQFAEPRTLVSEGHLSIARALHAQNDSTALQEYQSSINTNPDQLVAVLAQAQHFIKNSEWPAALDKYDQILRKNPRCIEALVSLASIRTFIGFTTRSITDSLVERKKAKEYYDQVLKLFATGKDNTQTRNQSIDKFVAKSERIKSIARDSDMYIEIGKLWSDESSLERSLKAFNEAERILNQEFNQTQLNPGLLNNIGVLLFHKGRFESALATFEEAITEVGTKVAQDDQGVMSFKNDCLFTPAMYNRGVTLEALGQIEEAQDMYRQVLATHPEYVDAKARLALLAMKNRGIDRTKALDEAHVLIKECLTSQPDNLELRALYTYWFVETNQNKFARDFAMTTLKSFNRHDVYALFAAGFLTYGETREIKEQTKEILKSKQIKFLRSTEFFDKALQLNSNCCFAAQGLAIAIAENTIGTGIDPNGPSGTNVRDGMNGHSSNSTTSNSIQAMQKNTKDALTILNKVKESINDASVYINIGHCHFLREEYDRAIEHYETASVKYYQEKNDTAMLYLARAWFHKANKESNYSALQSAIKACKTAVDLKPSDLASLWNLALVQQKGAEMLQSLKPERRTLIEIRQSLQDLAASQKIYEQLDSDSNPRPPYPKELLRQRLKYGESLLKKSEETIKIQTEFEQTEEAKILLAKRLREEEKQKQIEIEQNKLQEQKRKDLALAEQRRIMREEAVQWALSKSFADSEEEEGTNTNRKEKKKSGGGGGGGKKRTKKAQKSGTTEGDNEESAQETGSSDEEEVQKPKKKKTKQAKKPRRKSMSATPDAEGGEMELDEDGEEAVRGGNKRRKATKNFKSAEFIESDEDE